MDTLPTTAEATPAEATNPLLAPIDSQKATASSENPKLAALLAKKASGATLTKSEAGYLGGIGGGKRVALSAPVATANLLLAGDNQLPGKLAAPEANAKAETDLPARPAVDSTRLQAGAKAVCETLDRLAQTGIAWLATRLGHDKQTAKTAADGIAMQPAHKSLIVDNSAEPMQWLCDRFNIPPEKVSTWLTGSGLAAGLTMYALGIVAVVKTLKETAPNQATKEIK